MPLVAARLASMADTPYSRRAKYTHDTDAKSDMKASNYFNAAYVALPKGTVIECVAAMAGTPVHFQLVVTASSSSAVTVAEQNYA